jgi:tetratricopeptide (TPR) repeat protein
MFLLTTQIFQQVETLLHDKKFPEALHLLKSLDPSRAKGEEYGYYCILLTEAGLNVGEYFESYINEAIEIFRYCSASGKFARAKYLKGWLFSSLGRHHEAKEIFLEAYTNYLRCNDLNNAARVLNRLSYTTFQTGNIEAAIENLRKSLEIYDKLGETVIKTKVAHNLAHLYFTSGSLREALSIYNSYAMTEVVHGQKDTLIYYFMSALPSALRGDITTAKKTIEKCRPYLNKYIREKTIYYENLGLISILDGNYAGAEKALKEGLRISLEIAPESALVSQIKRLFGDLYIAMSNAGLDSRLHGNDKEPRNDIELRNDKDASFLRRQVGRNPCGSDNDECRNRPPVADFDLQANTSFLRRQESSDESFLRRQESSIALAEKYASEALAVAEKINERVEIAACYRIFAQVEQQVAHSSAVGTSLMALKRHVKLGSHSRTVGYPAGAPTIPTTSGGAPSVVNRPHPGPSPSERRGVPAGGVRIPYRTVKAREWYKKAA